MCEGRGKGRLAAGNGGRMSGTSVANKRKGLGEMDGDGWNGCGWVKRMRAARVGVGLWVGREGGAVSHSHTSL